MFRMRAFFFEYPDFLEYVECFVFSNFQFPPNFRMLRFFLLRNSNFSIIFQGVALVLLIFKVSLHFAKAPIF